MSNKIRTSLTVSLMSVLLLSMNRTAVADGLIDSRSITMEAGYDSDKTKTLYIDTELGLSSGYWVYLAAQKNYVKSVDSIDLDSRSYIAGFGNDNGDQWGYDITYENWGNPDDIDTDALRATITWTHSDLALSIMPQYREISLASVNNGDSVSFNERGLGGGIYFTGINDWILYMERYQYSFSKNPDFLDDFGVTDRLTFTATSLASGLYDHGTVVGISRWLDPIDITFQYTRDKSAIDKNLEHTIEAHLDYYFTNNVVPYLRIGRASFSGLSPLWFGNLGLQYSW